MGHCSSSGSSVKLVGLRINPEAFSYRLLVGGSAVSESRRVEVCGGGQSLSLALG